MPVFAELPSLPPRAPSSRFGHIDNLRAVAALLVMWTHLAENFAPRARPHAPIMGFVHWLPRLLNLGHVGVVLFFGISGFVIYGSLARRSRVNAGRRFLLSRFFRLYPAYWLSLLLGLIVLWWWPHLPTPWPMLVSNVAMISGLVGQTRVLGLYWTLETELIFYVLCWGLYRSGLMTRAWTLPVLAVGLLFGWKHMHDAMVWMEAHGRQMPDVIISMPRHLAVMFWGALCREAHEQTDGFRNRAKLWRSGRTWLALALMLLFMRWCAEDSWHDLLRAVGHWRAYKPQLSVAYLIAPVGFVLWLAGPRIDWRPLRWLGEISYSLYLFHPIVSGVLDRLMPAEPGKGYPLSAYVALGMAGTVAISAVVYYAVERPAIRLGARLAEGRPVSEAEAETPFKTVAP